MSAPPPLVTAYLPNMVLMLTSDCLSVDDVVEDDVTVIGNLSILMWSPPMPSEGLGHAGALVGVSDDTKQYIMR